NPGRSTRGLLLTILVLKHNSQRKLDYLVPALIEVIEALVAYDLGEPEIVACAQVQLAQPHTGSDHPGKLRTLAIGIKRSREITFPVVTQQEGDLRTYVYTNDGRRVQFYHDRHIDVIQGRFYRSVLSVHLKSFLAIENLRPDTHNKQVDTGKYAGMEPGLEVGGIPVELDLAHFRIVQPRFYSKVSLGECSGAQHQGESCE